MKIQKVSIRNFRNIENIQKEINGNNILLLGENQRGKSNFIKALEIALGMTSLVGVNPIMNGKKEASIQVITDDKGNEYKFEVKFKEGSDKPSITVTAPNGLKNTAKSVIGSIVGEIDFDIDAFVEMSKTEKGRKQQVEIVRSFLSEEVKTELRKHENTIKAQYDDRTEINRKIKTMQGFISESGLTPDDMKKYFLAEPIEKLTEELNAGINTNQNIQKAKSKFEEIDKSVERGVAEVQKLKDRIKEIEQLNESLLLDGKKIENWLAAKENQPVDISHLQEKMKDATAHNLMHEKVNSVRTQEMKAEELQAESEALTILIETTRQLISDTIKDLDMPIEGLSFNDDNLTYNGSVVDESTLSTSEIMMLGVKLKMAKNPNAKVLFIERGESLGSDKLHNLQKMAKDHGFQIIMEQVQRGTEELLIEIMPEYEIPVPA